MKESSLIAAIAAILMVAFVSLALRENFLASPEHSDWWSASFSSDRKSDASFKVANFGPRREFFYEVREGGSIVRADSFPLESAREQSVSVDNPNQLPVSVRIWTEGDANKESKDLAKTKEIYKK